MHNLQHHETKNKKTDDWTARWVITLASSVIVHSESARQEVIREFRMRRKTKLKVIPHGHYIDSYENSISTEQARVKLGIAEDKFVFLFLGNIRPYKGILELIEAFNACSELDKDLLLIVGKPLNAEWKNKVEHAAKSNEAIKLALHFVLDEQLQLYMNASDVVVFPYRQILTSGALILAMSFSKPCIAPRIGCISELLGEQGGYLYGPSSGCDLLRAMVSARSNSSKLPGIGRRNLKLARTWDWKTIARKTLACYEN